MTFEQILLNHDVCEYFPGTMRLALFPVISSSTAKGNCLKGINPTSDESCAVPGGVLDRASLVQQRAES